MAAELAQLGRSWSLLLLGPQLLCAFAIMSFRRLPLGQSHDSGQQQILRRALFRQLAERPFSGYFSQACEAFRRAKFKFPGRQKIIASRNWCARDAALSSSCPSVLIYAVCTSPHKPFELPDLFHLCAGSQHGD